jgi:NSS family neurotransmitter:Na+ symporter
MSARGNWSGTYGFIIAAIGSAVGLGNIWRFPYLTGMNGGGAFVLLYLVMSVFVGVSLLVAEQALGRYAATSPYGAFRSIHSKFGFVGTIAILANFLILSFYSMIGGWVIYYLFGSVIAPHTLTAEGFQTFSTSTVLPLLSQFAFMALTGFFVWRGISKGIEWGNRIMMPLLFLMLALIVIRSLTLPGAMEGVRFFFKPDFSKINGPTVISALGQVFFSMSVGFGIMLTYASYLGKDTPLSRSSWLIAMSNSLVAVLAGLAILPAVFSFKMEPEQGPGLLFVVIPEIFRQMSGGYFFGILFFLLVFFAALTSSISILEVPVSYLVDERKLSRKKSVIVASLIISVLGVFCTLSMGSTRGWCKVSGMGIFDLLDFVSNNMLLR